METAFRAVLDEGRPGRSVGLVCLYDAVAAVRPDGSIDAVHSCGHGPIAGGVTAAALALADRSDAFVGRLVVVGCPADEIHAPNTALRGGGKALSAEAGLWDDVDAALYAHPEFIDTVSLESRWMQRLSLVVSDARSLDGEPEPPLRAAQAVLAANEPDVMVERLELDGDVEEGTGLVLRAHVLVFADSEDELEQRAAAVVDRLPEGAWTRGRIVQGVRPDPEVTHAVSSAFAAAGRELRRRSASAPLRDRLRQHQSARPRRARRSRPTGGLGFPRRRGCDPVRVGCGDRLGHGDRPSAGALDRTSRNASMTSRRPVRAAKAPPSVDDCRRHRVVLGSARLSSACS